MNKRRQIYLWTENTEFFNNLKNKSAFINRLIKSYRENEKRSSDKS